MRNYTPVWDVISHYFPYLSNNLSLKNQFARKCYIFFVYIYHLLLLIVPMGSMICYVVLQSGLNNLSIRFLIASWLFAFFICI